MEGKINLAFIESYSRAYTEKVIKDFFEHKPQITGNELLEFCSPHQINLFILKEIFYRWKAETARLKSPWFDYNHENVKNALTRFMNVLSKHILIGKEDLRPLTEGAVAQTILLIFSPYEFYLKEFNRPGFNRITKENLYELKKYVKVNADLLDRFINKFEDDGIEAVFSDDAIRMFNEVCEQTRETPEDTDQYLAAFTEVLPLEVDNIYKNPEENGEKRLYEQLSAGEQKTLLDELNEETGNEKTILADQPLMDSGKGIKSNITINQRFMFVNELFSGNVDEFEITINTLENCQNRQEAIDFIRTNYIDNHIWEDDSEIVTEFMDMVVKYFPT